MSGDNPEAMVLVAPNMPALEMSGAKFSKNVTERKLCVPPTRQQRIEALEQVLQHATPMAH